MIRTVCRTSERQALCLHAPRLKYGVGLLSGREALIHPHLIGVKPLAAILAADSMLAPE